MKIYLGRSFLQSLLFLSLAFITGCNEPIDLGIGPLETNINIEDEKCQIAGILRTTGLNFQVSYIGNLLKEIKNFETFEKFIYVGNLLKSATIGNMADEAIFDFNAKGNLSVVTFQGKDSNGKPYSNSSRMTYDASGNMVKFDLGLPSFQNNAVLDLTYDTKGNVKKISRKLGNNTYVLLENKTFDDKNSPFLDQQLGQILTYYMIYFILIGDDNYTYFLNKNNVTEAVINNDNGRAELSVAYTYNAKNFPTKADIVKVINGKQKQTTEFFSYTCK
jgi:hypothetical protein